LTWEEDEPATVVAEQETAPPDEESTPASQAAFEVSAVEATLPEASVVKGEYFALVHVTPMSSRSHQV
jgi:hypothetical protein